MQYIARNKVDFHFTPRLCTGEKNIQVELKTAVFGFFCKWLTCAARRRFRVGLWRSGDLLLDQTLFFSPFSLPIFVSQHGLDSNIVLARRRWSSWRWVVSFCSTSAWPLLSSSLAGSSLWSVHAHTQIHTHTLVCAQVSACLVVTPERQNLLTAHMGPN